MTSQNAIFLSSEADSYTKRNAEHNAAYSIDTDIVTSVIKERALTPSSIIDLGCSTGERLSALCDRYGIKSLGVGVDASQMAIDIAEKRSPDLVWQRADWTSFATAFRFDLVILSFAMHWIDRKVLMDALKTIHDLTEVGSYVLINDFDPYHGEAVDCIYRHHEGVMTYKRCHGKMLAATGLYKWETDRMYDYPGTDRWLDRCSCALLRRIA